MDVMNSEFGRMYSKPFLLGLIGGKLSHSVSHIMHKAAARALGLDFHYFLFEIKSNELMLALRGMEVLGFTGCNVTIPYKEAVLKYADEMSDEVKFIGSANTLYFQDGKMIAENTDWLGFKESWRKLNVGNIWDSTAVILGAGGAALAVAYALAEAGIAVLHIFNRDLVRAEHLLYRIARQFPDISGRAFSIFDFDNIAASLERADYLINTTSVGMFPNVNESPIKLPKMINCKMRYYDLIYNPLKTRLARELEEKGFKTFGGLDMLVCQASQSFRIWTGLAPDEEVMANAAKEKLEFIS